MNGHVPLSSDLSNVLTSFCLGPSYVSESSINLEIPSGFKDIRYLYLSLLYSIQRISARGSTPLGRQNSKASERCCSFLGIQYIGDHSNNVALFNVVVSML